MSTSPMLPSGNAGQQLKNFWSRPEGKTGILILLAAGALALWGWGAIVGYIVSMLADTVHMAVLAAELFAIGWIAFSKRSHMLFRLLMRYLTGLIITIDPIGILKDRLQQMRKRRQAMGEQISSVSGQVRFLKDTIAKNETIAQRNMGAAAKAKEMAGAAHSDEERLRMQFQVNANARSAGRLKNANVSYSQLLTKLQTIYDMLTKWSIHIDFFISDTEDEVKQSEIQYKTVNAAYKAYRTALNVIRGNADENEIYNETMERLAEDAGRKLGEMEDFQRVAQNFMDNIDVQNGAVEESALQELNKYEQKLLTAGTQGETSFLLPGASQQRQPVPINRPSATGTDDYRDLLK